MQPSNIYYGGGSVPETNGSGLPTKRKLFLIIGGLLLLVTVGLAVFSSLNSAGRGSGTSREMMKLISDGESTESYKLLSSEAKLLTTETNWVGFVQSNKTLLAGSSGKKPVYTKSAGDSAIEEGYNLASSSGVKRLTIIVDTKNKEVESIRLNDTLL